MTPPRKTTWRSPLVGGAVLLLAGCAPTPLAPAVAAGWDEVFDARYGISYRRPPGWQAGDSPAGELVGPDGHASFLPVPPAWGPDDALTWFLGSWNPLGYADEALTVDGRPARLVMGRFGTGEPAVGLVELPGPIQQQGEAITTLAVGGDRLHLPGLLGSVRIRRDGLAFARGVLELLKTRYYRRDQVDWGRLAAMVERSAAGAATPADAYPAVAEALAALGDRHTFALPPRTRQRAFDQGSAGWGFELVGRPPCPITRVYPASPAARAGLLAGDRVLTMEVVAGELAVGYERAGRPGTARVANEDFDAALLPEYRQLGEVAYLELPGTLAASNTEPYEARLRELLARADAAGTRAWVLDLRRNPGGFLEPMLAPFGPLLGDGPFGGEEEPTGARTTYEVQGGRVILGAGVPFGPPAGADPVPLARPDAPVAVLAGPGTASAGEFVSMAFDGRPHTRRFGEPTYGVPTATASFDLWDGGYILTARGYGLDRRQIRHDGPLAPDERIETRYDRFATDQDAVLTRALAWLAAER